MCIYFWYLNCIISLKYVYGRFYIFSTSYLITVILTNQLSSSYAVLTRLTSKLPIQFVFLFFLPHKIHLCTQRNTKSKFPKAASFGVGLLQSCLFSTFIFFSYMYLAHMTMSRDHWIQWCDRTRISNVFQRTRNLNLIDLSFRCYLTIASASIYLAIINFALRRFNLQVDGGKKNELSSGYSKGTSFQIFRNLITAVLDILKQLSKLFLLN